MEIRNPFRDPVMRGVFANLVKAYQNKTKVLFTVDGKPLRSNSHAHHFWSGFNNDPLIWDADSKRRLMYAMFKAGRAVAKAEGRA